jgi:hypothetical protein
MKQCKCCNKEFEHYKSYTKYCSQECLKLFHHKQQMHKRKHDPVIKLKYRKSENARKRRKRAMDKEYRLKHSEREKNRYRKENGILSDADLKIAPKGSGTLTKHGYRQIVMKDHPNARRGGTMFEHTYVMSQHLGRPLNRGETVHHLNGIRDDNRIENLELWKGSHRYGQRVQDKIQWAKEFLKEYGYSVTEKT